MSARIVHVRGYVSPAIQKAGHPEACMRVGSASTNVFGSAVPPIGRADTIQNRDAHPRAPFIVDDPNGSQGETGLLGH
jgi:hypothetical protein